MLPIVPSHVHRGRGERGERERGVRREREREIGILMLF
jgi:hypothetical protein